MVTQPLVEKRVDAGRRLIEELRSTDFPVVAAFWVLEADASDWKLYLATPLYSEIGIPETNLRIVKLIHDLPPIRDAGLDVLPFWSVRAVSPDDDLVRNMLEAAGKWPGDDDVRMQGGRSIGQAYIEDAYVYRIV